MNAEAVGEQCVPEIRSNDRFARRLREIRARHKASLANWADSAYVDPTIISRLARGRQRPPERERLILMGESWSLSSKELSDLCLSAGYLPQLPPEFENNPNDMDILGNALYELLCGGEVKGYIQVLQSRLDQIRRQQ